MTSEIVVMNQRAIALAADSAVTMFDGGKVIVRNDQKKLFNLADGLPVAVMFYGVADLMGHPWDVLVEHYRAKAKPKPQAQVGDYAEGLFAALDGHEAFFPRARHQDEFKRLIASVHRFIFRFAQYLHETGTEGPDEAVLGKAIELVWLRYQTSADGTPRKDLACFPPGFADAIRRDYADVIEDMTGFSFGAFSLDRVARARLSEIAVFAVVKDLFLEDVTGLVVAGYGTDDPYPALTTYRVSAVVSGIVKRSRIQEARIDGDVHASIMLFADCEASYAFLRGIDFDIESRVYGTFYAAAADLADKVVTGFTNVDPAMCEAVRRQAREEHVPQAVKAAYEVINAYQQRTQIDPVLAVVEISTRRDLAETAHGLVGLNIFRKRVTAQDPTVGGEIDVATISRDAGFSWWKRQGA